MGGVHGRGACVRARGRHLIYALLIHSARPEDDPLPAAEERAILSRHRALQAEAIARSELLSVARLDGRDKARTVRVKGEEASVTDGPYMETKEWLVGFYLVECADEATALARARQICPEDGSVEIRPVNWQRTP
ncbi:YciI family protein [Sorangium sp. So ce542]|uniref:YciI family protein n=1 Tax=Sorangium sp. So ce542 TaxID=3133316 RepID=UPI003F610511